MPNLDAVVVGSGPNGLAAAIHLAQRGLSVRVFEAQDTLGGGLASEPFTLPGFLHDVCAALFPMALVSPFFRALPLDARFVHAPLPLAHPFVDGTAATVHVGDPPLLADADVLWPELLAPLHVPRAPFAMARFGLAALSPATTFARSHFRDDSARALFAGCAAHGFVPLTRPLSSAVGLVMMLTAQAGGWPFVEGGARNLARALVAVAAELGVTFATGVDVRDFRELPPARAVLFDTSPRALASICEARLPQTYREKLLAYRYGPAAFKIDWALSAPIPWRALACRSAAAVHVGGTFDDVVAAEACVARGEMPEHPFILVAQPTLVDKTRAPPGQHTAWAYAHVPHAWPHDVTALIEARLEEFAPGFREVILARHVLAPASLERRNHNDVGGHIIGGVADGTQLFARPVSPWAPYATPDPAIFICSSSTPPGAGVHGMCGYHAARCALARRFGV